MSAVAAEFLPARRRYAAFTSRRGPYSRAVARLALGAAALLVAAPAGAAVPAPGLPASAQVVLSSARAGARPVALTLELRYEMQCGYPGPGPVEVVLPTQERAPRTLVAAAVLVAGRPASAVRSSGHTLRIALAPPPRVMCDVIGPGLLTITFTRGSDLGNPVHAGVYTLSASVARATFSARFTILPA